MTVDTTGPSVLILWADEESTNLGVRVIAEGTSAAVRMADPTARVSFQSYGNGAAPVPLRARALAGMASPFSNRSPMTSWLGEHDLVIDTGAGDSFAGIYGARRLIEMSLVRRMAIKSGVSLVMGPQTVGPFPRRSDLAVARWSLKGANAVVARDNRSYREAQRLFSTPTALATDTVFNLARPARSDRHDVLVNVSGLLWRENTHVSAENYRAAVIGLVRSLLAKGRRVGLVAHVLDMPGHPDNDVSVMGEVTSAIGGGLESPVVPVDLADVREQLAGAQLVIGSRMHACLNALSVGTPTIPLAYSRKFSPLFQDLGWTQVMDLREPLDTLVSATVRASDDLTVHGPKLVATSLSEAGRRAKKFVEVVERALDGRE